MAYQSLYRRYRSQTFAEVLGQEHVTGALRNAVREGRVGHGYLFSGPRGTGKTSTARILAKVLNCENPVDGEPDATCDNCVAVAEGRNVDWLHELDAASNNGVEAMRDLLGRVSMGTSGNRKVYILDEVHMLSKGASNTLLKTLEEPPEHVVFILATTEPEKVLPTIRSRTQHFDFKLLTAETLASHVRHVIDDAELELDDDVVEHVVRSGGGSARDTLSALDQVAAAGGVDDEGAPIDDILAALATHDAGAALVAVDTLVRSGRHPRVLADALIASLRDAFLVAMGAPRGGLTDLAEAASRSLAEAIGPASLTSALEGIGSAIVEMRHAPDPRIPLEVALVRLTRPTGEAALEARVAALERAVASGGAVPVSATGAASPSDPSPSDPGGSGAAEPRIGPSADAGSADRPSSGAAAARAKLAAGRDSAPGERSTAESAQPSGSRPSLGGVRRAKSESETMSPSPDVEAPEPAAPAAKSEAEAPSPAPVAALTLAEVEGAWPDVLAGLKGRAKALYKAGTLSSVDGSIVSVSLPSESHRDHCAEKKDEVVAALSAHFATTMRLTLTIDGPGPQPALATPGGSSTGPAAAPKPEVLDDEMIDLDELTDAPDPTTGGVKVITDAFPGVEIEES